MTDRRRSTSGNGAPRWAEQLAGYNGPLGVVVGTAFGTLAGLLCKFESIRPRLTTAAAVTAIILLASDFGRQSIFYVVTWLGWWLRFHLVPWSIIDDEVSVIAIVFGAVVGSATADLAMYATVMPNSRRRLNET